MSTRLKRIEAAGEQRRERHVGARCRRDRVREPHALVEELRQVRKVCAVGRARCERSEAQRVDRDEQDVHAARLQLLTRPSTWRGRAARRGGGASFTSIGAVAVLIDAVARDVERTGMARRIAIVAIAAAEQRGAAVAIEVEDVSPQVHEVAALIAVGREYAARSAGSGSPHARGALRCRARAATAHATTECRPPRHVIRTATPASTRPHRRANVRGRIAGAEHVFSAHTIPPSMPATARMPTSASRGRRCGACVHRPRARRGERATARPATGTAPRARAAASARRRRRTASRTPGS